MAETLGSLVDKLTIKEIREFHIREMIGKGSGKFSDKELQAKIAVLDKQKKQITAEIDSFVSAALKDKISLRDEKIKLYNARDVIGKVTADGLGEAMSGLARKNLELWHLEDEARRTDVPLEHIGGIKRKIDLANQQRNDFIDRIDELFEKMIVESKRHGKKS